jgi:hypothetical protein
MLCSMANLAGSGVAICEIPHAGKKIGSAGVGTCTSAVLRRYASRGSLVAADHAEPE